VKGREESRVKQGKVNILEKIIPPMVKNGGMMEMEIIKGQWSVLVQIGFWE
jgi:ubiquitin-protein ligase